MTDEKDARMSVVDVERLLDRAAETGAPPSDALLGRVMADADNVLEARKPNAPAPQPRANLGRRLLAGFGGWPAVAGLAAATVAGVWIGYAQPGAVAVVTDSMGFDQAEYQVGDLMPDFDAVLAGG